MSRRTSSSGAAGTLLAVLALSGCAGGSSPAEWAQREEVVSTRRSADGSARQLHDRLGTLPGAVTTVEDWCVQGADNVWDHDTFRVRCTHGVHTMVPAGTSSPDPALDPLRARLRAAGCPVGTDFGARWRTVVNGGGSVWSGTCGSTSGTVTVATERRWLLSPLDSVPPGATVVTRQLPTDQQVTAALEAGPVLVVTTSSTYSEQPR